MSQEFLTKKEIAAKLSINSKTLATYCNKKYYKALEALGYSCSQKKLTPAQYNYLAEKLGID